MASSSLSQEDFDNEYELSTRRSRIRTARARNIPPSRSDIMNLAADPDSESVGPPAYPGQLDHTDSLEHEASPKPTIRAKDKRCQRPNHVNKGKAQRERRKLREKRRSTGVVHLPSTESTGGSTGEDDELLMSAETRRNTTYNEAHPEKGQYTASEGAGPSKPFPQRINKSPSDLDADDEDNQDYDSAVNQSDSTISLVQETGDNLRSSFQNGRPETPCSENLEELLERAHEENHRLLELVKEKDDKIAFLEQKIISLNRNLTKADSETRKLQEENRALLNAFGELSAK